MAKKVSIVSVEVLEGVYTVTYESGTVRKYTTAPKTVLEWLEKAAPVAVEEAPAEDARPAESVQAPVEVEEAVPAPVVPVVPAPVVVRASTPVAVAEPVPAVNPTPAPVWHPLDILARVWESVLCIWDGATSAIEVTWEMVLPVLAVLVQVFASLGRGAVVVSCGFVKAGRGAIKMAKTISRVAVKAAMITRQVALTVRQMVVAVAPVIIWGVVQAAGYLVVLVLLATKSGARTVRAVKAGWAFREELITEWREEAA